MRRPWPLVLPLVLAGCTFGPVSEEPTGEGVATDNSPTRCRSSEDCVAPQVCAESTDGAVCLAMSVLPAGVEVPPSGPAGQPAPPVGMLEGMRRLQALEAPR